MIRASIVFASAKSLVASSPTTESVRISGKRPWSSQAEKKGPQSMKSAISFSVKR
jgi:predicted secreted protein